MYKHKWYRHIISYWINCLIILQDEEKLIEQCVDQFRTSCYLQAETAEKELWNIHNSHCRYKKSKQDK